MGDQVHCTYEASRKSVYHPSLATRGQFGSGFDLIMITTAKSSRLLLLHATTLQSATVLCRPTSGHLLHLNGPRRARLARHLQIQVVSLVNTRFLLEGLVRQRLVMVAVSALATAESGRTLLCRLGMPGVAVRLQIRQRLVLG